MTEFCFLCIEMNQLLKPTISLVSMLGGVVVVMVVVRLSLPLSYIRYFMLHSCISL
jgi:hypothetical protein